MLSEYIKANKHHGFSIVMLNGRPTLHIEPGVIPVEKERWQALTRAVELFKIAEPDIRYLTANRMLKLPKHPGWR